MSPAQWARARRSRCGFRSDAGRLHRNRDYLTRLLSPHWTVETVRDGTEALELARAHQPDLVLADVMMPGLDGFALLRELRGDPALNSIPVVLVTARAGEEAAIEGLLAGADDYVVKPFSARELIARVGGQLELARARRRAAELNEFLVRFSDAVRGLTDPEPVTETACRILLQRLHADRVAWAEVDWEMRHYVADCVVLSDGTRAEPSRWPLDMDEQFTSEHLAEQPVVYADSETDPRISDRTKAEMARRGLRSGIAMPIRVGSKLGAVLSVGQHEPRRWTSEEVAFVEVLAGRAWAEIERAPTEAVLRESEERFRALANASADASTA